MRKGQAAQKDGIDDAENGGVRPDAESEDGDDDERKRGSFPEHAGRVAQVSKEQAHGKSNLREIIALQRHEIQYRAKRTNMLLTRPRRLQLSPCVASFRWARHSPDLRDATAGTSLTARAPRQYRHY